MRKSAVTIEVGPWRFSQRPRVLIEHPDPDTGLELATALAHAGCAIAICHGPDAAADPPTRCPLHQLEPCALVEGADVVVTALGLDHQEAREVVRGLRRRYPSRPLVATATVPEMLELRDEFHDCIVIPREAKPDQIVAAVLDALSLPA